MPDKKKPIGILKEYFGLKDGETVKDFADECKQLKQSGEENYRELVDLAAEELGVEPDYAS